MLNYNNFRMNRELFSTTLSFFSGTYRCGSVAAAWRSIPAPTLAMCSLKRPHTHDPTSSRILYGPQRFGWAPTSSTSTTGTLQPERFDAQIQNISNIFPYNI